MKRIRLVVSFGDAGLYKDIDMPAIPNPGDAVRVEGYTLHVSRAAAVPPRTFLVNGRVKPAVGIILIHIGLHDATYEALQSMGWEHYT